jgi:APA family basic amino acid/polyamine antiporter
MLGAGVFAVFAPAAQAAGVWLLAGLGIAGVVAVANATSSAQLAAQLPTSGGTYVYGRAMLGPWWGFAAGWAFVVGKTASAAAMALTIAAYLVPHEWVRPVAGLVVVAAVALGYRGVTRTARATGVLVVVVLAGLAGVVGGAAAGGVLDLARLTGGPATGTGVRDVLGAAALLFFAFAGYARLATLGEEVRDPARTIPRAITLALGIALVVYVVVAVALVAGLGVSGLAASHAPVADLAAQVSPVLVVVVRVAAVAASAGALLALLAGLGRTALAMAREGDLPRGLAAVHPVHATPYRAELAVGVAVAAVAVAVDVRGAIGFSSVGVLAYYLVANLSALRQVRAHRRYPRALAVVGAVGCAALATSLPVTTVTVGLAVVAAGLAGRWVVRRGQGAGSGDAAH